MSVFNIIISTIINIFTIIVNINQMLLGMLNKYTIEDN